MSKSHGASLMPSRRTNPLRRSNACEGYLKEIVRERYVDEGSELYNFGSYSLDLSSRILTRSGEVVTLAPKTFDLLALLVKSKGRLLSKGELMVSLWPGTFVEEANLSFQISALRKALGEDGLEWIETVPKHGYRFTAIVNQEEFKQAAGTLTWGQTGGVMEEALVFAGSSLGVRTLQSPRLWSECLAGCAGAGGVFASRSADCIPGI